MELLDLLKGVVLIPFYIVYGLIVWVNHIYDSIKWLRIRY